MEKKRYVYWQDKDMWLGYLEEYPDYLTQGDSLEELVENLKDIHNDLMSGEIPAVRRVAELEIK
ncbi:MAG: type II toxin-antitoxin system HicB family antitoxin [Dehalococcoidia bacterium]